MTLCWFLVSFSAIPPGVGAPLSPAPAPPPTPVHNMHSTQLSNSQKNYGLQNPATLGPHLGSTTSWLCDLRQVGKLL